MNLKPPRTWSKIASISVVTALMLLQLLSLPFYSGSSLGPRLSWRFEHARLAVSLHQPQSCESFYVAINSEGLKWMPEFQWNSLSDWKVILPLWPFVAASGVWFALSCRRTKFNHTRCASCGYELAGLASCPECGSRPPTTPK